MSILTKVPVDAHAEEWVTRELERRRAAARAASGSETQPASGSQGAIEPPLASRSAGGPTAQDPTLA